MSAHQSPLRVPAQPVKPYPRLRAGDKVKLASTKRQWTVRAVTRSGRFVILTQPFNLRRTVLYTVIDFDRGVRGRDDHYGVGYETPDQVADALAGFERTERVAKACEAGTVRELNDQIAAIHDEGPSYEVSHRSGNHVRLDIESVNNEPTDRFGRPIGAQP